MLLRRIPSISIIVLSPIDLNVFKISIFIIVIYQMFNLMMRMAYCRQFLAISVHKSAIRKIKWKKSSANWRCDSVFGDKKSNAYALCAYYLYVGDTVRRLDFIVYIKRFNLRQQQWISHQSVPSAHDCTHTYFTFMYYVCIVCNAVTIAYTQHSPSLHLWLQITIIIITIIIIIDMMCKTVSVSYINEMDWQQTRRTTT